MEMTRHHNSRGMAATGIGLAAGLGGGALLLGIAGLWGLNQASKARAMANQNSLNNLAALTLAERTSRETWQNQHTPTLLQYVDARSSAGAGAGAGANALSIAEALALANNSGINAAIAHDCSLKVQRVSGARACDC